MYQKILVPLDGSDWAECTPPHVEPPVERGFAGQNVALGVLHESHIPVLLIRPASCRT